MDQNKDSKKKAEKGEQVSKEELERLELLQRAHEKKGRQLTIDGKQGSLKEIDELRELVGKQLENPEEKYNIYYNGIRRLLMDHLPKGSASKEMREIIYDEKNIFLNLGKRKSDNSGIRGSDGRMTFQPVMNEILDIIINWIGGSQNPFELYREFYMLNERHDYLHEDYDQSTAAVAQAMMKLADDNNELD